MLLGVLRKRFSYFGLAALVGLMGFVGPASLNIAYAQDIASITGNSGGGECQCNHGGGGTAAKGLVIVRVHE